MCWNGNTLRHRITVHICPPLLTAECICALSLALPGVYVGCLDGVEEQLGHSDTLHVDEVGLEQSLRGLKPLSTHLDHTAIWQLEMCGRKEMKEKKKESMTPLKQ